MLVINIDEKTVFSLLNIFKNKNDLKYLVIRKCEDKVYMS